MARALSPQTLAAIEKLCEHYPSRMAALLPALHLVQEAHSYISGDAELDLADLLQVPPTRVHEVVTFYTMFHASPPGRHVFKICRNLPCQMRGADKVIARAEAILGVKVGETTADGRVTLAHEECLASCGTAPMAWCDGQFVENLDEQKLETFLAALP